ncbi:MAG: histidine triad nucleotide-binding protein [Roseobacter sp.]
MAYSYDENNIFAKILRGEIPNTTVLETEHSLAFRDIYPQAPIHVLVIPKGPYVSYDHFAADATDAEVIDYTRAIAKVCQMEGVTMDGSAGFRLISNAGEDAVQEVPHLHVHILGGRPLGRMLAKAKDDQ